MSKKIVDVKIPDIGGAEDVRVIEVLVSSGDQVEAEDALLTLESDKATMDVPAPMAGTISSLQVKVDDKVSEGDVILQIEIKASADDKKNNSKTTQKKKGKAAEAAKVAVTESAEAAEVECEVRIPDIGGAEGVAVIELIAKPGDQLQSDDPLLTLESDKATMDVPAPFAGELLSLKCKVGDKVSEGDVIAMMKVAASAGTHAKQATSTPSDHAAAGEDDDAVMTDHVSAGGDLAEGGLDWDDDETAILEPNFYAAVNVYAGPAVRRLARELGVDLTLLKKKSGAKGRITKKDIKAYVKDRLQQGSQGLATGSSAAAVDFSRFGEIQRVPLGRIQKISGPFLQRNWSSIPHVTQFAEADITALEAFRQEKKAEATAQGVRLTPLAFIMKALEAALLKFPKFNASLDADGEHLILKKYIHIGVAMDTPNGLVVGVVRDVNKKGVYALAKELAQLSAKAREKGLSPQEMQGGCMTISSLGGIGGTAFTPIVNAPEVAILGVSRSQHKPVYDKKLAEFSPRLLLPLCLSYDHRVVDGADGARFISYLSACLTDLENLIL